MRFRPTANRPADLQPWAFAALVVLLMAALLSAAGCSRHRPAPTGLLKIDESWTAVEEYGDVALSRLDDAKRQMGSGDARVKVEQAASALGPDGQKRVIAEGRKATGVATDQYAALKKEHDRTLSNRWVRGALKAQRLFWTIVIAGSVLTVFGFAANAAGFAWGSNALKGIGTVVFAILTGGFSLIKTASVWLGTKATGQKRVTLPTATADVAVAKVRDAKRATSASNVTVPIPADPPPRGPDRE